LLSANRAHIAWLGGNDIERQGVWVWADGPEAGITFWTGDRSRIWPKGPFNAWDTGEPNNSRDEDAIGMWGPAGGSSAGAWLDMVSSDTKDYVVEYSTIPDTSAPQPQNLLVNGNFESGNIGFTSTYLYSPTDTTRERSYAVVSDPRNTDAGAASLKDHTTGAGLMLVANGSSDSSDVVWSQTVPVATNRTYAFSGWGATWGHGSGQDFDPASPTIRIYFNGTQHSAVVQLRAANGQWQSFSVLWDAGSSTQAIIQIRLATTASIGNDIALDDLSLFTLTTNQFGSLNIQRAVDLEWPSVSNRLYQVQWASSVQSETWSNLGAPVLARGTNTSFTDRVSVWDTRFYRLLSLE